MMDDLVPQTILNTLDPTRSEHMDSGVLRYFQSDQYDTLGLDGGVGGVVVATSRIGSLSINAPSSFTFRRVRAASRR